jgi:ribosomal protein S18 acetylase RimI-like enzyme
VINIAVRRATLHDLEDIRKLGHLLARFEYESGFDTDIDPDWAFSDAATRHTAQRITDDECIALVAVDADEVVGFLMGSIREAKGGPTGALESMLVLPHYRKRGIGRGLVERFLDWTRRKGLQRFTVAVAPANKAAVALYLQMGFQEQTLILERRA